MRTDATRGAVESAATPVDPRWAFAEGERLVVRRGFEHACCLKGAVESTLSATTWDVAVKLGGEPCRCLCESAIAATSEPLAAGEYLVRFWVDGTLSDSASVVVGRAGDP